MDLNVPGQKSIDPDVLANFLAEGYEVTKFFPGEYLLMENRTSCAKVRIYTDGRVWEISERTGWNYKLCPV